jgi:hypothetical protein
MITSKHQGRWRDSLLAFGAGAALLAASLANFLVHNDYPILRADVGIDAFVLFLIAAAMVPFYVGQRQWGRSVLGGALVLLFADLNGASVWLSLLAGSAFGLFTWWRRVSLTGPLALFGVVILLTTIMGVGGRPKWLHTDTRNVSRPPQAGRPEFAVLHVLLDEQAGVAGIYPDANGLRLRQELRNFFLSRGFALYGRAYSEHMHTANAIPAVLNFGSRLSPNASQSGVRVGPTVYFDQLHRQGFKVNVLQNDFAELCEKNPVSVCTTYDSSSLRPTLDAPLNLGDRAKLIGLKFVALSKTVRPVSQLFNEAGVLARRSGFVWSAFEPGNTSRTSTVAAAVALREWSSRLRHARPGEVYFAHLLLPHYPHVFRADCSYLPWNEWELRRSNTPLETRRRSYAEQDRCTLRLLGKMIREFEESPGGRKGVIIVHGDHGSRIVRTAPVTDFAGYFSDQDVIAGHATLFAVREPQPQPQYYETPQPISGLLREFAVRGFRSAPTPNSSLIRGYVMSDKRWRPQRWEKLPQNW